MILLIGGLALVGIHGKNIFFSEEHMLSPFLCVPRILSPQLQRFRSTCSEVFPCFYSNVRVDAIISWLLQRLWLALVPGSEGGLVTLVASLRMKLLYLASLRMRLLYLRY